MPYNSGKEEEQSRKLFIGGISQETSDDKMNEYFSKYGNVVDCIVIRESGTNRSKGFGFVTFEMETEADACMNERPHSLDGRTIDVKRAVSREESSKPGAHVQVKKIFIGGIKEGCDENALRDYFGQFGSIDSCEIPLQNDRPKGFAFITYNDFDIVDKLVAKRYHDVAGMRCEVKKALSKQEMEKAKQQLEQKSQNRSSRRGGGSGGGSSGNSSHYGNDYHGNQGYGGYDGYDSYDGYEGGDYNNGYGSYGDGYGSYGSYNDGYGSGYGGSSSNYGPMKGQYNQRGSGPYGGGYGSGNSSYDSGYGGYGTYSQGYGSGGGASGYGGYGGQSQSGSSRGGRGRGRGKY